MQKKVMIALDDSRSSKNAVKYACSITAWVKNVEFTLFHVQPMISQYLLDEAEKDLRAKAELKKVIAKNTEAVKNLLEKYKEQMVRMGVAEQSVEVVTLPRKLGLAKDILAYSENGRYDAVIMGRRGLSGIQEIFVGSVSANVIENSTTIPIWLIDGEVGSSKIMFAVDGSENSLRAVSHLALMMSDNPDTKVLFFHVQPKVKDVCPIDFNDADSQQVEEIVLKGDKQCIDRFFAHALKKLKDVGVHENQIEVKVAQALLSPAKAIVEEAKQGEYDTILVGRRGINKTFFTGSVSRYVINKLVDKALWIVP